MVGVSTLNIYAKLPLAQWLRYADEILVLGEDGRITAQGDFQSVLLASPYAREFCQTQNDVEQTLNISPKGTQVVPVAKILPNTQPTSITLEKKKASLTKHHSHQTRNIGNLRYYLSSMGGKAVLGYAIIVLLQTGCGTAQRKFQVWSLSEKLLRD
jgi:hypothetical protein